MTIRVRESAICSQHGAAPPASPGKWALHCSASSVRPQWVNQRERHFSAVLPSGSTVVVRSLQSPTVLQPGAIYMDEDRQYFQFVDNVGSDQEPACCCCGCSWAAGHRTSFLHEGVHGFDVYGLGTRLGRFCIATASSTFGDTSLHNTHGRACCSRVFTVYQVWREGSSPIWSKTGQTTGKKCSSCDYCCLTGKELA